MPEDFEPCLIIYEYEDICVFTVFTQIGENVVSASAGVCTKDIMTYCKSFNTSADDDSEQNFSVGGALTQESSPTNHSDRPKDSVSDLKHRGK